MKLAVFFPGIGYHTDKPLLYYTKKMARKDGYDIKDVPYGNFPGGVKGSPEKMREVFESALSQSEEILKDVPWETYEDILFVSKSVGTAVAAAYAGRHHLATRNLFFTPVEQSFAFMKDPGLVFTGTSDPWVEKGSVIQHCGEKGYSAIVIDGGDHSLETGEPLKDLDNMKRIMEQVEGYIEEFHIASGK